MHKFSCSIHSFNEGKWWLTERIRIFLYYLVSVEFNVS